MKIKPGGEQPSPRRRDLLGFAVMATTLVGLSAKHAAAAPACEAEDTDAGSASMRKALEYSSPSKTVGKTCSICAFYAATAPNCGKCQIINGPVSNGAVCSSWAPKE
jgi:hypothetical protein